MNKLKTQVLVSIVGDGDDSFHTNMQIGCDEFSFMLLLFLIHDYL